MPTVLLEDGNEVVVFGAMCRYHGGLDVFLKTLTYMQGYDLVKGVSWEKYKFSNTF